MTIIANSLEELTLDGQSVGPAILYAATHPDLAPQIQLAVYQWRDGFLIAKAAELQSDEAALGALETVSQGLIAKAAGVLASDLADADKIEACRGVLVEAGKSQKQRDLEAAQADLQAAQARVAALQ